MPDQNLRIHVRFDTATNFASVNPVLGPGEIAITSDTGVWKAGNGVTAYNALPAAIGGGGTVNLTGNQTVNGNKTFTGDVTVNSTGKVKLGNGLEVFFDGNDSHVKDVGAGSLILGTNGPEIRIQSNDGKVMARFTKDGAAELFHNGVKRAESTSSGFTVIGELRSTTIAGGLIATQEQTDEGTDNEHAVTPLRLRQAQPRPVWLGPVNATGTAFSVTGIPEWANQIEVMLSGLSFATLDNMLVRLGTAAAIATTGYVSERKDETETSTVGMIVGLGTASRLLMGQMTLRRVAAGGHTWHATHTCLASDISHGRGNGYVTLSAPLTRLQFVGVAGATFDAGSVSMICRQ